MFSELSQLSNIIFTKNLWSIYNFDRSCLHLSKFCEQNTFDVPLLFFLLLKKGIWSSIKKMEGVKITSNFPLGIGPFKEYILQKLLYLCRSLWLIFDYIVAMLHKSFPVLHHQLCMGEVACGDWWDQQVFFSCRHDLWAGSLASPDTTAQ